MGLRLVSLQMELGGYERPIFAIFFSYFMGLIIADLNLLSCVFLFMNHLPESELHSERLSGGLVKDLY